MERFNAGFNLGPISEADWIVPARQSREKGLKALQAFVVEAL
jgi:hypothetical protein